MSLISTVRCGNTWVRYFVVETEPYFGDLPDASPDWDNLDMLMNSFPGKISDEEVEVPLSVVTFLEKLLIEPETKTTAEVLELTKGCPINLHRLANYLTGYVDLNDGDDVTGGVAVTLIKAYYSVAPSLMELSALKVGELGLTTEQVKEMLNQEMIRNIKTKTGITAVGKR